MEGLVKHFELTGGFWGRRAVVRAVDGVSFHIRRGETLGLVGESGCGKTTTGRTIIKLYEPTAGSIIFDGRDITNLKEKEMLPLRKKMQIIFQDPYASLNARLTVGDIISEPLEIHRLARGQKKRERTAELLRKVGLSPDHINRYPHEFSGGQRQRIGIARALAVNPDFIVCDEPISALDVSIQAQVVNLLEDLQQEMGLTYLFIAHNLPMVKHISNRIGVMYLGKLVEIAESGELFRKPTHPYTRALLSAGAAPGTDPAPGSINPPDGCRFRTRCPNALDICSRSEPELMRVGRDHLAACHLGI